MEQRMLPRSVGKLASQALPDTAGHNSVTQLLRKLAVAVLATDHHGHLGPGLPIARLLRVSEISASTIYYDKSSNCGG